MDKYTYESAIARVKRVGVKLVMMFDRTFLFVEEPVGIHTKGALDFLNHFPDVFVVYGEAPK